MNGLLKVKVAAGSANQDVDLLGALSWAGRERGAERGDGERGGGCDCANWACVPPARTFL